MTPRHQRDWLFGPARYPLVEAAASDKQDQTLITGGQIRVPGSAFDVIWIARPVLRRKCYIAQNQHNIAESAVRISHQRLVSGGREGIGNDTHNCRLPLRRCPRTVLQGRYIDSDNPFGCGRRRWDRISFWDE